MAFKGKSQDEKPKVRTQYCGKCENGWLFRPDPEEGSYHGKTLSYPCACNLKGQEIVAEERDKVRDEYRAGMSRVSKQAE